MALLRKVLPLARRAAIFTTATTPAMRDKAPVLCLHGLTRNCRDFDALALHIAPRGA